MSGNRENTSFGKNSLHQIRNSQNSTNVGNTAIGFHTLLNANNATNTIALGHSSGKNLKQGNNNIYIGNSGNETESNKIYIGNDSHLTNIDTLNVTTSTANVSNAITSNVGTENVGTSNVGTSNVDTSNVKTSNVDISNVGTENVGTSNVSNDLHIKGNSLHYFMKLILLVGVKLVEFARGELDSHLKQDKEQCLIKLEFLLNKLLEYQSNVTGNIIESPAAEEEHAEEEHAEAPEAEEEHAEEEHAEAPEAEEEHEDDAANEAINNLMNLLESLNKGKGNNNDNNDEDEHAEGAEEEVAEEGAAAEEDAPTDAVPLPPQIPGEEFAVSDIRVRDLEGLSVSFSNNSKAGTPRFDVVITDVPINLFTIPAVFAVGETNGCGAANDLSIVCPGDEVAVSGFSLTFGDESRQFTRRFALDNVQIVAQEVLDVNGDPTEDARQDVVWVLWSVRFEDVSLLVNGETRAMVHLGNIELASAIFSGNSSENDAQNVSVTSVISGALNAINGNIEPVEAAEPEEPAEPDMAQVIGELEDLEVETEAAEPSNAPSDTQVINDLVSQLQNLLNQ